RPGRSSGPPCDDEQARIREQDLTVGLGRVCLLKAVAIASQKRAVLVVREPLQKWLQSGAREPVDDALRRVESVYVGRHPDVDPRRDRPKPLVIFLEA